MDKFTNGDLTRLDNLLQDYRDHIIQNCAEINTHINSTKDKGQIVANCVENVSNSIKTLRRYM